MFVKTNRFKNFYMFQVIKFSMSSYVWLLEW